MNISVDAIYFVKVQSIAQKLTFIESVFGKGELASNGKNFSVRCPICAPKSLDKRKLAIRVSDDAHHCWTCGWRAYSLAPLIRKYGTLDQLRHYKAIYAPQKSNDEIELLEKKASPLPTNFSLLTTDFSGNPDVKAVWNYLISRNVTLRDAWHYKLGTSNDPRWRRRVIMPSFDSNGELNFFVARNIDKFDKRTKYDNPEDDKYEIVFNELNIDWDRRLVICEGPFDMMKCGDNATALLGSDLSTRSRLFSQILLHGTPVAIALDGDMWHTKTPKIARLLQSYDIDVILVDTRERGDPGSMSKSEFKNLLEIAQVPTWESMFFNKLEKISNNSLRIN